MHTLLVLLLSLVSAAAAGYSLKDLGPITDLAGRSEAGPKAINRSGAVAGVDGAYGSYRAMLYSAGAWTNLGTLGGAESLAAALNDSGQEAGYSATATSASHAFLWTPGGTDGVAGNPQMKDLGSLTDGTSQAYAINIQGQVAGYSDVLQGSKLLQHAVIWRNGAITDIGNLLSNGLPNSFGYGINGSGHVAGTAYNASYATAHAFLYDGTTATDIGGLGGSGASALAINNTDRVTGYAGTSSGYDHAFRYALGVMNDLGTLGGHYSYGLGINNSNVIVGGSFVDVGDTVYHAFIWSNNVMQDLNSLVDATGAAWVLVEARALNDAGQIVGTGTYQGATHGFLLSPVGGTVPPRITSVAVLGKDLLLSFQSINQATYSIQTNRALSVGIWADQMIGIQGNGGIVSVTNVGGAALPFLFYRVKLSGG